MEAAEIVKARDVGAMTHGRGNGDGRNELERGGGGREN